LLRSRRRLRRYWDPALDPDATWLPITSLVDVDVVLWADVRRPAGAARALAAARAAGVPAVLGRDVAAVATLRELCRCCDYATFSRAGLNLASGAVAAGDVFHGAFALAIGERRAVADAAPKSRRC
jgi:sugar/nucleoside kinase (ribokinase family)